LNAGMMQRRVPAQVHEKKMSILRGKVRLQFVLNHDRGALSALSALVVPQ
jgi:hypothetical protein